MPSKGEIHDWPRFDEEWKLYCEQMLPDDIQRMRLLKRLLDGPAKELAAYLRDTSKDYHILMETLSQTYDQPEAILQHLNKKLKSITRPRRETAKEMRELYNKLNAVCRQLKNADCDVNHRLYLEQVMEKLPEQCLKELRKVQLDTAPNRFNTEFVLERIGKYVLDLEFIQRATDCPAATHSDQH